MKLIKLILLLVVFFIPGTLAQNNETLKGVEVYAGERVLTEGNLTEVNWSSYETLNFPIIKMQQNKISGLHIECKKCRDIEVKTCD